jgi:carbonic anhydrase
MLLSCHSEQRNEKIAASSVDLVADVMTEEKQKQMSMEAILEDLMFGNKRFMESKMILRDHKAQLNQLAAAQHPKAVVLSCIDSRVPVEQIFDQGIGDLFVVRVAGNIDNDHNIASIEYGCKVAGAKLLIVLGHEQCGAIKSAVKGVDMGNITELLTHMRPAIEHHRDFPGDQSVDNHDFLEIITKENAVMTLDDIRRHSEIIRNMEAQGLIKLVAAYYDLDEGKIEIINEEDYHFDD